MNRIDIIQAFEDQKIFGALIRDQSTFSNWKVCLKAIFALSVDRRELRTYRKFTGRNRFPSQRFSEVFLAIGRRGGKSLISAICAVYLAVFYDWRPQLAPGEIGYVMCIATDRKQASVVLNYIKAILRLPIFKGMVLNETKEEIELKNQISIAVVTCSYRTLRGYAVVAAILDEIAFWRSEGANPDKEILTALRPSLANIDGSLLLSISSIYAKSGILWDAFQKYGHDDPDTLFWRASTQEMNPTFKTKVIKRALKEDYSAARSEYFGEFRKDLETYLNVEAIDAVVGQGRFELPKIGGANYMAFCDPSGGRQDSMTLSIAHKEEGGKVIQDLIKVARPPFNPESIVKEFSAVLKGYGVNRVTGDRYSGEWVVSSFQKEGIFYENSPLSKSELYLEFLALVMQGQVELLDNRQQTIELRQLERRTGKGRDSVDHPKGLHDDLANSCAGVCVLAIAEVKPISQKIHREAARPLEPDHSESDEPMTKKEIWDFLYDEDERAADHEENVKFGLVRDDKEGDEDF